MFNENITARDGSTLPRVLVLDDDADTLIFLGKILSKISLDAIPIASCSAARYAARMLGPIDIVIADAQLPDGSGVDLAIELKREYGCATIIMSGIDPPDSGLPCGVDLWIVKPVFLPELENAVRTLARRVRRRIGILTLSPTPS